jgi:hypothetical protein
VLYYELENADEGFGRSWRSLWQGGSMMIAIVIMVEEAQQVPNPALTVATTTVTTALIHFHFLFCLSFLTPRPHADSGCHATTVLHSFFTFEFLSLIIRSYNRFY